MATMTIDRPTTSQLAGHASREHEQDRKPLKLTIVLPALNEEGAIGGTIRRCLDARESILKQTPVTEVEIVVVSDGSTDRTIEIARSFDDVQVIIFKKNRGYGAAIKAGWRQSNGDLLAFLDADGTCDPLYFVDMCNVAVREGADVVLGSRMGPDSKMPKVRRIGNRVFAAMLGALSHKSVSDSASGMRVVRRESLTRLLPLPNGLSFTPAMSARALMDHELTIREIPMRYEERIGRSKLSVIKDGLRFVREILSAAVYIKPSRITLPIALLMTVIAAALSIFPTAFYVTHGFLPEWLIYRFLTVLLLAVGGITLLSVTVVAEHMIAISQLRYDRFIECNGSWWGRRALSACWYAGIALVPVAILLVWPGIVSYLRTQTIPETTLHWSRVVVAMFFVITFIQMIGTACILRILRAMHDRQQFLVGRE